jgi:hypothetical protein
MYSIKKIMENLKFNSTISQTIFLNISKRFNHFLEHCSSLESEKIFYDDICKQTYDLNSVHYNNIPELKTLINDGKSLELKIYNLGDLHCIIEDAFISYQINVTDINMNSISIEFKREYILCFGNGDEYLFQENSSNVKIESSEKIYKAILK